MFLRLMMLIKGVDNQTVFFYKYSLEQSFFYSDLLFLVGWFVYLIRLTAQRFYKFLLIIGGAFTILFYLTMAILYSVSHGGEAMVIPTNQVKGEYLIRIGDLAGIHPGNDLHRDLFVYKKTFPLTYTKVYETNRSIEREVFEAYRKGDVHLTIQNDQRILVLADEEIVIEGSMRSIK